MVKNITKLANTDPINGISDMFKIVIHALDSECYSL